MTTLSQRHDFVLIFDVTNGNPNGDPDAGNLPRLDPETNHGLVSDVSLKRKIRNYVELAREGEAGHHIYVQEGAILNDKHRQAYIALRPDDPKATKDAKLNPRDDAEAKALRDFMCANFFDVRTFGAVMSTGINCGQVKGPVQMTFASSVEPILPVEVSITRMAATNEAEQKKRAEGDDTDVRTMGRKHIVPYGLYVAHGRDASDRPRPDHDCAVDVRGHEGLFPPLASCDCQLLVLSCGNRRHVFDHLRADAGAAQRNG